jgi:phosphocarrier protein
MPSKEPTNFFPPKFMESNSPRPHPKNIAAAGIYQCLAEVTIVNKRGLHARASAVFVKTVEQFDAEVTVTKDGQTVSGGSIMGLLMLGASPGSTILIETEGPEAEEALEALTALIEGRFNEAE